MKSLLSLAKVAELLGVSKETLRRWDSRGKLIAYRHPINGYRMYHKTDVDALIPFLATKIDSIVPVIDYKSIELFAGAGGLALGLEKANINCVLLNEIDKDACETLRKNRTNWNVLHRDVSKVDFKSYREKIHILTGGFPCQSFSYAGKRLGFEDARGTLFYEFARAIKEVRPLIAVGENVRGLLNHEGGKTLEGMISILEEIGYKVLRPRVLKAIHYRVPQKRERLFIVAIREDIPLDFQYPTPGAELFTLKDALKKGRLYSSDVPFSEGQQYPEAKRKIMDLVPPGGYWRDLPLELQKSYMKKSFYLGGGKTGMARRISWTEPSLTLTCAPAQKQTERCHPEETRPFTVREYARIQTFPDDWQFVGSLSSQYKQIGNAVPVNLAYAIGRELVRALNNHFSLAKVA